MNCVDAQLVVQGNHWLGWPLRETRVLKRETMRRSYLVILAMIVVVGRYSERRWPITRPDSAAAVARPGSGPDLTSAQPGVGKSRWHG